MCIQPLAPYSFFVLLMVPLASFLPLSLFSRHCVSFLWHSERAFKVIECLAGFNFYFYLLTLFPSLAFALSPRHLSYFFLLILQRLFFLFFSDWRNR